MITVVTAVALAVIGVVFALPMDAGVALLEPILEPLLTPIGLQVDRYGDVRIRTPSPPSMKFTAT